MGCGGGTHCPSGDEWPTCQPVPLYASGNVITTTGSFTLHRYLSTAPMPLLMNNYQQNAWGVPFTVTPGIGDDFFWRFKLGPRYSMWAVSLVYMRGPDYGKILLGWATSPENTPSTDPNYPGNVPGPQDGSALMQEGAGVTFVDGPTANNVWEINCYQAVEAQDNIDGMGVIRLLGSDGQALSSIASPVGGVWSADGGAGIYYLRLKISGKAVSSTSYKAAVAGLSVIREDVQPNYG